MSVTRNIIFGMFKDFSIVKFWFFFASKEKPKNASVNNVVDIFLFHLLFLLDELKLSIVE